MAYDYREAMKQDIREWIKENYEYIEDSVDDYKNAEEVCEFLNDELWTVDAVTGNASGSYTFNRKQAKEYVLANIDLAGKAMSEFGYTAEVFGEKILDEEWEWLDVTIRCYLLGEVIADVVEGIMTEYYDE